MIVFFSVLQIVVCFLLFALLHSCFASISIKTRIKKILKTYYNFYRLLYNLISLLFFYLCYEIPSKPDITIYDLNYPYDIVIFIIQIFALIGLIWSCSYMDFMEFVGFAQIKRWHRNEYDDIDFAGIAGFRTDGPFKLCRHPVYFFSILFLGLRPAMSIFYLLFYICIIIYFYIGSFWEEKKLLAEFGWDYEDYMKKVPRILPINF